LSEENKNRCPRRPEGIIYKIFEIFKLRTDVDENSAMSQFKIREIPVMMAVGAGLINREFLDVKLKESEKY
jgi:lipopolysaccharide/colanic/teichoic acid biosynthesis glycosyltransferase